MHMQEDTESVHILSKKARHGGPTVIRVFGEMAQMKPVSQARITWIDAEVGCLMLLNLQVHLPKYDPQVKLGDIQRRRIHVN